MKIGLIKERKTPPDRRVVFTPEHLKRLEKKYKDLKFIVEPSDIRIFTDDAYIEKGIEVNADLSDCDVLLGVKEVPIDALIPDKSYFFFSHTIKMQPYNRDLLKAILDKNIKLYDHEVITNKNDSRLIGFGRYAGLVGAYNGFRALGLRDGLFNLNKVENLPDLNAVKNELNKISIPGMKICLTGKGKVGYGAKEILDYLKIKEVSATDYLNKNFEEVVYTHIDFLDYNKLKETTGARKGKSHFYEHPEAYKSDFMKYAKVTDFFIAGHYYGEGAPYLITKEDTKSADFKINLIADVSCDIDGPIASTIRPSTIADPFYGYDAEKEKEVSFDADNAITVMAVDNLPCELPKDASEGFGDMFEKHVIPAFFNNDKDGILERALMTSEGELTQRYSYLQEFVDE